VGACSGAGPDPRRPPPSANHRLPRGATRRPRA